MIKVIQRIIDWRIQQGQILDVFVQTWLDADAEIRDRYLYRLDTSTPMPRFVITNDGTRVCEISLRKGETYVEWIRSLDDLKNIDSVGQSMMRDMEED